MSVVTNFMWCSAGAAALAWQAYGFWASVTALL